MVVLDSKMVLGMLTLSILHVGAMEICKKSKLKVIYVFTTRPTCLVIALEHKNLNHLISMVESAGL